ncbi:MAG: metalloregulator ArsR/SmtB family transcription factor [Pseudomonadota bacterium]
MKSDEDEYHEHEKLRNLASESDATFERAARLFKALADPERLKLISILSQGEACVSELATKDQMSTVSQRLKILKTENLVASKRSGKHINYRLTDEHVFELIDNAIAHVNEKKT